MCCARAVDVVHVRLMSVFVCLCVCVCVFVFVCDCAFCVREHDICVYEGEGPVRNRRCAQSRHWFADYPRERVG